jgi:hypothetical protein
MGDCSTEDDSIPYLKVESGPKYVFGAEYAVVPCVDTDGLMQQSHQLDIVVPDHWDCYLAVIFCSSKWLGLYDRLKKR